MSTLTVCPYCGEGMRFDSMKQHLNSCEGRSPLPKPQPRSQTSKSPSPAKAKQVIGLEFYNQLNRLSALTRSRSSSNNNNSSISGGRGRNRFAASPEMRDAATVRELMFPSTSLTIDIAPSRSPTSASSYGALGEEEAQQRHNAQSSWAAPTAMDSVSPLRPPPPPAVRVQLTEAGKSALHREGGDSKSEHLDPSLSSSQRSSSARAVPASSAPVESMAATKASRMRLEGNGRATGVSSRSHSRSSRGEVAQGRRLEPATSSMSNRGPSESESAAHKSSSQAQRYPAVPTGDQGKNNTGSLLPVTSGARLPEGSWANSTVSSISNASVQRPTPQASSFAIRLRNSGGEGPQGTKESASDKCDCGQREAGRADRSFSTDLAATVTQLSEALRQVRQVVGKQQEQFNALLHAHADLNRQVTAQQGAYNGMVRRSLDQATTIEATLQRHTSQWRNEESALHESIDALWANVFEIQQKVSHVGESAPTTALTLQQPLTHSHPALDVVQHTAASAASTSHAGTPASTSLKAAAFHTIARNQADTPSIEVQSHHSQPDGSVQPAATPAPPISVQRSASAEESTYYSDIGSFIHSDAPEFSAPASATIARSQGSAPSASAFDSVKAAHHSTFTQSPPISYARPAVAAAVTPPKIFTRAVSSTASPLYQPSSATSSLSHTARRSTTLPRTSPFVTDVLQKQTQRQQVQQQSTRAAMEDRVVAMLHAKPAVVVHRSPWT